MSYFSLCAKKSGSQLVMGESPFPLIENLAHQAEGLGLALHYPHVIDGVPEFSASKSRRRDVFRSGGEKGIYLLNPWYISNSGVLIITTDYILDTGITVIPDLVSDLNAVGWLSQHYQDQVRRARHFIRQSGLSRKDVRLPKAPTGPTISYYQNDASDSIPVVNGADPTDFSLIDLDEIAQDHNHTNAFSLLNKALDDCPDPLFLQGHSKSIDELRSLSAVSRLTQEQVLVMAYHGSSIRRLALLSRTSRLPAEVLFEKVQMADKHALVSSLLATLPLVQEFFRSQGIQVSL